MCAKSGPCSIWYMERPGSATVSNIITRNRPGNSEAYGFPDVFLNLIAMFSFQYYLLRKIEKESFSMHTVK